MFLAPPAQNTMSDGLLLSGVAIPAVYVELVAVICAVDELRVSVPLFEVLLIEAGITFHPPMLALSENKYPEVSSPNSFDPAALYPAIPALLSVTELTSGFVPVYKAPLSMFKFPIFPVLAVILPVISASVDVSFPVLAAIVDAPTVNEPPDIVMFLA